MTILLTVLLAASPCRGLLSTSGTIRIHGLSHRPTTDQVVALLGANAVEEGEQHQRTLRYCATSAEGHPVTITFAWAFNRFALKVLANVPAASRTCRTVRTPLVLYPPVAVGGSASDAIRALGLKNISYGEKAEFTCSETIPVTPKERDAILRNGALSGKLVWYRDVTLRLMITGGVLVGIEQIEWLEPGWVGGGLE